MALLWKLLVIVVVSLIIAKSQQDYVVVTGWATTVNATCAQLDQTLTPDTNVTVNSSSSLCWNYYGGAWGVFYCNSSGAATTLLFTGADCTGSYYQLNSADVPYGTGLCYDQTTPNAIFGLQEMQVTCYSGPYVPPAPVAVPVAPPISPPVAPPTSTIPQAPVPVAPVAPVAPVSLPVAAPVTPPTTPPPTAISKEVNISVIYGYCFSATEQTVAILPANISACQDILGYYFQLDCNATGSAYGFICQDSTCGTCYPLTSSGGWNEWSCALNNSLQSVEFACSPYNPPPPPVPPVASPQAPTLPPTGLPVPPAQPPTASAPVIPAPTTPIAPPPQAPPTVSWVLSTDTICGNAFVSGTLTSDSAACQTIEPSFSWGVVSCTNTGSPTGKICSTSSCTTGCVTIPANSAQWGNTTCVATGSESVSLVCNQPVVVPSGPNGPSAPVLPPVSTGGPLSFFAFLDVNCNAKSVILNTTIVANISLCQKVSAAGQTLYVQADCYANGTLHGAICGTTPGCGAGQCNVLPNAASGVCVPYSQSLVKAIMAVCPTPPPPSVPSASNPSPTSNTSRLSVESLLWLAIALASIAGLL